MSINYSQSPLQQKLKTVPDPIMSWIGSEIVIYIIMDINRKFNVPREKISVLPRLLLRLETKDLAPQDFSDELTKELALTVKETNSAVEEIKEKILEPVKKDLFDWGIDINLMRQNVPSFQNAPPAFSPRPIEPPLQRDLKQAPLTNPGQFPPASSGQINPVRSSHGVLNPAFATQLAEHSSTQQATGHSTSNGIKQTAEPAKPFMLYHKEEQRPIAQSIKIKMPGEIPILAKPTTAAPAIKLETPLPAQDFPRIVHYSELKTPVNSAGLDGQAVQSAIKKPISPAPNEEVIDLNSFQKIKTIVKPPISPTAQPPLINGQPKIEGNIVDLR